MYTEISLHLSENEIHSLASGHPVRITRASLASKTTPICVTSTQLKKIKKVAEGKQKYTAIKLSKSALKRCSKQVGGSFWGSIGSTLKNTFTTPSGILGIASMLPTPLSTPLKAASVVAKLTGNGVVPHSRSRAATKLFNVDAFNTNTYKISSGAHHDEITKALSGMGFLPHHIQHMKGAGVFSNIWSGIRKLGTILAPYIEKEGHRLVNEYGPMIVKGAAKHATTLVNSYMNGHGTQGRYIVKFTKPQLAYIKRKMSGNGIFSDLASSIGLGFRSGAASAFHASSSHSGPRAICSLTKRERGGNLMTIGSVR